MKQKVLAFLLASALCLSMFSAVSAADVSAASGTIDVVSTSHLDTKWSWDLEETVSKYIPTTFIDNFKLIDEYPDYQFNFEGAYRYQLLEEYYPELFEELKGYVDSGNWNVAGSALENGDVNVPSPEALYRNIMYGNYYWRDTLGVMSRDIYLPDCFGFGYTLPTIAATSNLVGFSTQKLSWGNTFPNGTLPFDIGKWVGVDGSSIIANINYNGYTTNYNTGVRNNSDLLNKLSDTGIGVIAGLFGRGGDRGGGAYEATIRAVSQEIASNDTNSLKVQFASTDDLFLNLTDEQENELESYDGELLMNTHGTGCYTSRTTSKRWNRKAEQIADAAERSNVASDWLGASEYPTDAFEDMWTSVIAHQFHDDITGTSNSTVYQRTDNDYMVAVKQFASEYENGVSGVTASMDTTVSKTAAVPIVVNNPVAADRTDVVECTVTLDSTLPYVRVYDTDGNEVAAQVLSRVANEYTIAFTASVGSMGYRTYEVMPSSIASQISTDLSIAVMKMNYQLSNDKYTVTVNKSGDISSIVDKELNTELLSEPIRLSLFDLTSYNSWPSWQLMMDDYAFQTGDEYVGDDGTTVSMKIVENGPARVALEITRSFGESTYTQTLSLTAGGEIVRVDNSVDWEESAKLLKAEFNLAASNPTATYDLGLGTIERENNTSNKSEVSVQTWADVTDTDGSFGVSIINDCKYGMDKYDDNTIRLSLIHTPKDDYTHDTDTFGYDGEYGSSGQSVMDQGLNEFAYAIYGHGGSYSDSDVQIEAAAFNQPMNAFQTTAHEGVLGSNYSFGSVSNSNVLVRALKKAEYSDEIIVRFNEGSGSAQTGVEFTLGNGIESAREVYADEEPLGDATVVDGKLVFDIGSFEVKTFALTLKSADDGVVGENASESVSLPYNIDAYSSNDNKTDGGIDVIGDCYPTELVDETETAAGVTYTMGDMTDGKDNAVSAAGQTITLPSGYTTLHLLAASTNGDQDAVFYVDNQAVTLNIGDFAENIASADLADLGITGYVKDQTPAVVASHRHTYGEDNIEATTYMFSYTLDITGATTITLPENSEIIVFAATAVNDANTKITTASQLYDEREKTADTKTSITASFDGNDTDISLADSTSNIKNVSNGKVEVSTEQSYSGSSSLKISGTDTSSDGSYIYLNISTEPFKVTPGTILTYKYYAGNTLGTYTAVDMTFSYGNPLRDLSGAVDENGVRVHPDTGHGTVGQWVTVTIDLYNYAPDKLINTIMLAYDHAADTGDFYAYIDDLYVGVPTDQLSQLMNTAATLDRSNYSDATLAALDNAYSLAETVTASDSSTEHDIDYVTDMLYNAVNGLIEKRSAYSSIFAPDYNDKMTSIIKTDTKDGVATNLGGIGDEAWVTYDGIQFGNRGASTITLNYSGWKTGTDAIAEVHLGDKYGELIATVPIPKTTDGSTADWSQYTTATAQLSKVVTGEQDITIVFKRQSFEDGNDGNVCNFKALTFGSAELKSSLTDLYNEASALDTTGASEYRLSRLTAATAAAKAVIDNASATEAEVDSAYTTLQDAIDNLFATDVIKGDVDQNGKVTVSDVVELRGIIMTADWTDAQLEAGDLDGNGTLTVSDVVDLRDYIMKGVSN